MGAEIRTLRRREVPAAANLLARAFAGDGIISRFLGCEGHRAARAHGAFFRSVLHEYVPSSTVSAAWEGAQLVGVAIWEPPQTTSSASARSLAAANRAMVRALFPRGSRELDRGLSRMAQMQPPGPHWHLHFVGIAPEAQRSGIGSTLLTPVLVRADNQRLPCHLETPFPQTRAFYRRLGFEEVATIEPFTTARPLWTMRRPPRGE